MAPPPDGPSGSSSRAVELPRPAMLALPETAPTIEQLFAFMREAERRFRTLRMRIVERRQTAAGPAETTVEIWLAHPGRAKVIENRPVPGAPAGDGRGTYSVWVSDGMRVRTYDAGSNIATDRSHRHVPEEIGDPGLPRFARVEPSITELPMESLAEAFIHPAGLARNLATGRVTLTGQVRIAGREALVLEVETPRATLIETDLPDRWVILGVDRETGVVMLLEERVGETVTRRAEVTDLEPDAPIRDEAFTIHVPQDAVRMF
jgi:outer membrane lipoprotein-sorting protein